MFIIWRLYDLSTMSLSFTGINMLFSFPLPAPSSLQQTKSLLLGPPLEHSIPRSMKADATLLQGT